MVGTGLTNRTAMAFSLEARVPFLDHEFIELCSRIPPGLKMRGRQAKYVLRRAAEGLLPEDIAWRGKRGLSAPLGAWLRGELPGFAADSLSPRRLQEKGYFDPTIVGRMLAEHRAGRRSHGVPLMGVLSVQLWDDLFMHGSWRQAGVGA